MAINITVTIDDGADANIVPDYMAAIRYNGPATAQGRLNAFKADLRSMIVDKLVRYRQDVAGQAAINSVNTNPPITIP